MSNIHNLTPKIINSLSYPDFIGFINQWNTPPGAYSTVSKWALFSRMTKQANILDVGCSTGFSSRELAILTGCSGVGLDLSKKSIEMAKYNKKHYAPKIRVSYKSGDGYDFKSQRKFTHIIVGGNLKFFSDPYSMLNRCTDLLRDGGYILAASYYETNKMPHDLINKVHDSLGIPLQAFSNFSYKEMMKLYNGLEIIYEDKNELILETKEEIEYYCKSIIDRACDMHNIQDQEIYKTMHERLFAIRELINETRLYQKYCILVLRYRKSIYLNRFVPLF